MYKVIYKVNKKSFTKTLEMCSLALIITKHSESKLYKENSIEEK